MGFRFSAVFGFFESGDFDITIPRKGEILDIILKTGMSETIVWNAEKGFLPQMAGLRRNSHGTNSKSDANRNNF